MIWPAKRRRGCAFSRSVASSSFGELRKVLRCSAAEPRELGLLQAGDGAEDARLLAVLELGLEADHVEQRAELVVLAQLHDRVGLHRRLHADW